MSGHLTCPNCGHENSADRALCLHCSGALTKSTHTGPARYLGEMISERYRIKERIARGGMGEVYLAEHIETDQLLAVKFLHKKYAADSAFSARFFNEQRYMSRVTHPNAVTMVDYGRLDDGTLFLVMEYVRGHSLRHVVRTQHFIDVPRAVRIASQVAEVLASAHEKKIIHRDVKPDNIMIVQGPGDRVSVKVLDFGIAKLLDDETGNHTEPGVMFGTPEYMSPEQALGKDYDHRVDIYALGLVFYYMLAGHPPFQSKNKMAVLQQQAKSIPEPIQSVSKQPLPKALIELINDMLEKSPDDRPADMIEVLERLDAVLADPAFEADILSIEPARPVTPSTVLAPAPVADAHAAHVDPPAAASRVRRGEDYAPIAREASHDPLAPVASHPQDSYHFTQTETRIPPLSLGKGSAQPATPPPSNERLGLIVGLIAACSVLVVLSIMWLLPAKHTDDDVDEPLAALDEDPDASAPEEDTAQGGPDQADLNPPAAAERAKKNDQSATPSRDKTEPATRHAQHMTRARNALAAGDLGTMRSALSDIPTTDPPEGFKELRAQLLRAEKLTADLRSALESKQCDHATTAANTLRTEFDEKLAAPYRGRIEQCVAAAQAAKPSSAPSPATEAPKASAPTPPVVQEKPAASPATPPPSKTEEKQPTPAAKPAPPKEVPATSAPQTPPASDAPQRLPQDPPKASPLPQEKPPAKDEGPSDVLPPMEL